MVEAAFVTHFPIPPIYPYLPFTPGYYIMIVHVSESESVVSVHSRTVVFLSAVALKVTVVTPLPMYVAVYPSVVLVGIAPDTAPISVSGGGE